MIPSSIVFFLSSLSLSFVFFVSIPTSTSLHPGNHVFGFITSSRSYKPLTSSYPLFFDYYIVPASSTNAFPLEPLVATSFQRQEGPESWGASLSLPLIAGILFISPSWACFQLSHTTRVNTDTHISSILCHMISQVSWSRKSAIRTVPSLRMRFSPFDGCS